MTSLRLESQRLGLAATLCLLSVFGLSATAFGQAEAGDSRAALLEAALEDYVGSVDLEAWRPPRSFFAAEPAQPATTPDPGGLLPLPDYSGDWKTREFLSGDWGGTRSEWANKGVTFDFHWFLVTQGIVDGGLDSSWTGVTNLDYYITLDLMRMKLLDGAMIKFRGQSRFGTTVNDKTGLLLPVNNYSNFPLTTEIDKNVPFAITELNYVQFVSEELGFVIGKITTMSNANEFAGGQGRTQFMNFQFIYTAAFAQVAPYSTLAVGAIWNATPKVTVTSILMNTTDSSTTTGFSDIGEGTSWWTSVDYQYRAGELPGGATFGLVYAFDGDFARIGGINWTPGQGVSPETKSEAWAAYVSAWQYILVRGTTPDAIDPRDNRQDLEGLGLFLILGFGDKTTNPATFTVSGGLSGRGMIPTRVDDTYGLGYFYNDLEDPRLFAVIPMTLRTQGLELYYNFAIARAIALTFDFQWTQSAFEGVDDALILAARMNLRF